MLTLRDAEKPWLGAFGTPTIASFVKFQYVVRSKPRRSENKPPSSPPSISVVVSGRRSALPGLSGSTPGVPVKTDRAANVVNLSKAPGDLPAWPIALRTFRLLMTLGRNPCSETIQDTSAFGYDLNP